NLHRPRIHPSKQICPTPPGARPQSSSCKISPSLSLSLVLSSRRARNKKRKAHGGGDRHQEAPGARRRSLPPGGQEAFAVRLRLHLRLQEARSARGGHVRQGGAGVPPAHGRDGCRQVGPRHPWRRRRRHPRGPPRGRLPGRLPWRPLGGADPRRGRRRGLRGPLHRHGARRRPDPPRPAQPHGPFPGGHGARCHAPAPARRRVGHRAGALHRDVKPENVLVGPGGALKICDFGSATPVRPPYDPEDRVGTLWYLAPEMLKGSRCYGPPVDMWALGCVMLELLTGEPMFLGVETKDDLLVEVSQLRHKMDSDGMAAFKGLPPDLSKAAGELLCGLLCFDEGKRLTAAQALNHRWFSESEEAESMGLLTEDASEEAESLGPEDT
ncbi:cyclin-dependent kinase F-1, partial [Sorghum bicolor]|uniref:cyclin-dependent kinase F-1 n=1 Tax=Sorghum bicolor TaxID=4558 RepID=UPI000B4240F9